METWMNNKYTTYVFYKVTTNWFLVIHTIRVIDTFECFFFYFSNMSLIKFCLVSFFFKMLRENNANLSSYQIQQLFRCKNIVYYNYGMKS